MSAPLPLLDSTKELIPLMDVTLPNGEVVPGAVGDHSITIDKNNEFYRNIVKIVTIFGVIFNV